MDGLVDVAGAVAVVSGAVVSVTETWTPRADDATVPFVTVYAKPSTYVPLDVGVYVKAPVDVSEMVAVKSGLGYVLWDAYYVGRMDVVIADMVSIGLLGYLSDRLIVALEFAALRWRRMQSFNQ